MYESCWGGPAGEKSHFLTMVFYHLILDLVFKEALCDIIAGPSPMEGELTLTCFMKIYTFLTPPQFQSQVRGC